MKNFLQIANGVDIMPLRLQIQRNPQLWREDTYMRDYPQGPFGDTETIMLRFPEKRVFEQQAELDAYARGEGKFDLHENIDYPAYAVLTDARRLVMDLMNRTQGERLGRVLINKIRPGGVIFPHADTPLHAEYWDRYHVVLESQPGVIFKCGGEQVYMPQGSVWWFQNLEEHEVINNSPVDRTHMVIDIRNSRPPKQ